MAACLGLLFLLVIAQYLNVANHSDNSRIYIYFFVILSSVVFGNETEYSVIMVKIL